MKIFIPSYNRPFTATTPGLLDRCAVDYILVLRNKQQVQLYLKNPAFRRIKHRITVCDEDGSINVAREACRSLLDYGEWCLQMDDNIRGFSIAELGFYWTVTDLGCHPPRSEFDHIMNVMVPFSTFYEQAILDSVSEAERRGSNIVTFAPHENPYFRQKKWRDVGYTMNKCVLLRKTNLRWDQSENHPAMEEYALCAAMHLEYGRVLINNYAHPLAGHYEPGGLGPYDERLPGKIAACKNIMARYPGFCRNSDKKSGAREGELTVRFRTLEQVERWRQEMRANNVDPNYRDLVDAAVV